MRINPVASNLYHKLNTETPIRNVTDTNQTAKSPSKVDRIEVSSKAYETLDDGNLTATSGKDSLEITKGSGENSFVIHFPNSALVSRTVSRGYITVNGTDIELTDDVKNQLTQMDKLAEKGREFATSKYVMEHEMAVAQQQGETSKKMADDNARAIKIAAKISKGYKVSPAEERELLELNPQMYSTSKLLATMVKPRGKHKEDLMKNQEVRRVDNRATEGVSWSDFEHKSYETKLTVSLSDTASFDGVTVSEVSP